MKIRTKGLFLLILVAAVGVQFVPVDRTNPEVTAPLSAPDHVMAVFKRSCFDCHSNETTWPLYSYIAPLSWFVADHVEEGRHELNFSEWDHYSSFRKQELHEEIYEHVAEGEMPLTSYLFLHPSAKLSAADIEALRVWSGVEPKAGDDHGDDDDEEEEEEEGHEH